MGQALSKRFLTPRLSQLQQKYNKQLLEEVKSDIKSKQKRAAEVSSAYTDTNALEGGFKRGAEKTLREVQQEEFLRGRVKGSEEDVAGVQEMPEDLIKFLNEAGPVQRQVDKTQTSPRLYDALTKEEEERKLRELQKSSSSSSGTTKEDRGDGRTRRRMPMVEGLQNEEEGGLQGGEVEDKTYAMMTTTERTTNFSNKVEEEKEDLLNLRLSNDEICTLLNSQLRNASYSSSSEAAASPVSKIAQLQKGTIAGGGPITDTMLAQAEESAASHLNSILPSSSSLSQTQQTNTKSLLKSTLLHTAIPTLMKDTDGTLIAVWENQLQEMSLRALEVVDLESGDVRLTVDNGGLGFKNEKGKVGGGGGGDDGVNEKKIGATVS